MPSTYPDVGVLATVVLLGVFQQKNLHYGLAVLTVCYGAGKGDVNLISKALPEQGQWAGRAVHDQIETWGNKHYVTTSGLIVHPDFLGQGIAKRIKDYTFTLARVRWPKAKIFSLTSGDAVMKMNTRLGYVPVSYNQLTDDDAFWRGCEGCCNHDILVAKERKFCICTGMLYDPEMHTGEPTPIEVFQDIIRTLTLRGIAF